MRIELERQGGFGAFPGRRVAGEVDTSALAAPEARELEGLVHTASFFSLPARLGEPARAMVLARHSGGRMRETFPVLLGTLVSQSALNIVALVALGAIIVGSTDLFHTNTEKLFLASTAPLLLLVAVVLAPTVVRRNGSGRIAPIARAIRDALVQVRSGLHVFRDPRRGSVTGRAGP